MCIISQWGAKKDNWIEKEIPLNTENLGKVVGIEIMRLGARIN